MDFDNDFLPHYRQKDKPEKVLLDKVKRKGNWSAFVFNLKKTGTCTPELQEAFHLMWVESGHRIRARVRNDRKLLKVMRTLLPAYEGEGQWLYRGESIDRYRSGKLGFCWTNDQSVAAMFARGLNNVGSGGVLLKAWAPASAILADIHPHSGIWLKENEITVNWYSIEHLQVIQEYT